MILLGRINCSLVVPKLCFLLFFGGMSCLIPYLSIYFDKIGLSAEEIGLLQSVRPFIGAVAAPLVSAIADKTHKHRLILIFLLVSGTFLRFTTMFIGNSFIYFLFSIVVIEFLSAPTGSLINNAVLETLDSNKKDYGKQRLYGAVGWGTMSLIIGAIVTETGNIFYCFWSYLVITLLSTVVAFFLKQTKSDSHMDKSFFKRAFMLLTSSVETFLTYIIAFIMGIAAGVHYTFLFLFLQSLGGTELLMGLSLTVTCIAELPFFFLF